MTDSTGWPAIPEDEMAAFHQTADVFLNTANGLVGQEPQQQVGAAFLYAGARFTAFAMQSQVEEGAEVDLTTRDWLTARFDEELRDHAAQQLRREAWTPVAPGQVPDAAIDVLMGINELTEEPRRAFMRLADRFIHPANDMIEEVAIARISAAMMHACTRFNAYVLQARGLSPGPLDENIATDFRNAFRALLDFHLGQSVVTERGQGQE
ncbi:MAG: DUF3144 domain-containing protein [Paracoccaceae bacterium]